MIPTIGYWSLIIAFIIALLQVVPNKNTTNKKLTAAVFAFIAASFSCLVYSYAASDFSVLNVYNNSHTAKPFIYKISGAWGNHEGSMLLLALILASYNFALALSSKKDLKTINVQSFIISGFLAFIIFTSNPFDIISPAPDNGLGLNPLLQDIGLAMHPPILYVGYIGMSVALSFSLVALINGKADQAWAALLKKWVLFSWAFLTFGIGLGSWWAYRELGWGGFWFWDPVENASLMPWLSATALLHSLIVMEKREVLKIWTVFLGIFTFILSLLGIFLVRSGVLTSVHSFANDPARGSFILAFLAVIVIVSFALFAARAHLLVGEKSNKKTGEVHLRSPSPVGGVGDKAQLFAPLSKEGIILINNLLLIVACATVILGTLYPIFLEIFSSSRVSVGAPYFNSTFNIIALPLLVLAGFAPMVSWKKDSFKNLRVKLQVPITAAIFVAGFVAFVPETKSAIAVISLAFCTYLIVSMSMLLKERLENSSVIPMSFYAMVLAHIGVGILVVGITIVSIWGTEKEQIIPIGGQIKISGYDVKLVDMFIGAGDNYLMRQGVFEIWSGNKQLAALKPEVRFYPIEQNNTTESDIYYSLLSNIYVAMGDSDEQGGFVVRVYYKPAVNLIWLGCLIMTAGGLLGLVRRRV